MKCSSIGNLIQWLRRIVFSLAEIVYGLVKDTDVTPKKAGKGTLYRDVGFMNTAVIGVEHLPVQTFCPERLVRLEER